MSNEKLNRLTPKDIWVFTKQSVDFDNAFKAVKLFKEMPNRDTNKIEIYFKNNFKRYGIDTDRHRVLIIAQLFGLLTKTPPYKRGGSYNKENPTEMFELLNKCEIGSIEYNKLKTEQILKVKIRAVIDGAENNIDWNILPVIFSYKVLRQLKEHYKIDSVNIDLFYTYVMTCSKFSEVNEAVEYIKNNATASQYIDVYRDRSRFITLASGNLNLFNISRTEISLNPNFDNYFNDNFMEKLDIEELNIQLSRDVDYTYFLTTYQGFDVNLIDENVDRPENLGLVDTPKSRKKKVVKDVMGALEDDDTDYVEKVDDVKEYNINENIAKYAFKNKPSATTAGILKRYSKNPLVGKVSIKKADYKCENNISHETFISAHTNHQFMEAHHLIPINQQEVMWERYGVNVDCTENIVSLCPNCHREIHYAVKEVKRELIQKLYKIKKNELSNIGLYTSLDELFEIYEV